MLNRLLGQSKCATFAFFCACCVCCQEVVVIVCWLMAAYSSPWRAIAGNDRACCPKGHLDSALAFGGNSLLQGKAKQGKKEKARPENLGWRGAWVVVGGCSGISEQRAESRGAGVARCVYGPDGSIAAKPYRSWLLDLVRDKFWLIHQLFAGSCLTSFAQKF